mmetsp:Transcript_14237/g.57904  ORF Transcript_14237/g.57904 Transcript_14237/m.57904 type:complete len:210 (-) Transcript_14237:28-657(-)
MSTRRRSARAGGVRVLLDCLVRDWAPGRRGRRARRGRARTRRTRRTRRRRRRRTSRSLRARRPRTDGTAAPFARGNPPTCCCSRPVPALARRRWPTRSSASPRPRPPPSRRSRRRTLRPCANRASRRPSASSRSRAPTAAGGRVARTRGGWRCAWRWRHRRRFRGVGALGSAPRSPFASRWRSPSRALFGALFALSGVGRSLGRCAEVV